MTRGILAAMEHADHDHLALCDLVENMVGFVAFHPDAAQLGPFWRGLWMFGNASKSRFQAPEVTVRMSQSEVQDALSVQARNIQTR